MSKASAKKRKTPAVTPEGAPETLCHAEEHSYAPPVLLSRVAESMSVCATHCSRDLRYLWASKAYADWLGRSRDEIVGRPIVEILGQEVFEKLHPHFNTVLNGHDVRYEEEVNIPGVGRRWIQATYTPTFDTAGTPDGWVAVIVDVDDRVRSQRSLAQRAAQQAAVATLGQQALAESDIVVLMNAAVRTVAEVLDTDYCKLLELRDGGDLLLRAAVGWREGLVGKATVSSGRESQAGYTLLSRKPVVVEDFRRETRFEAPGLLKDHGVASGVSCLIAGPAGQPYGVLGAHAKCRRDYSQEDVNFVQAVANILGAAIQRQCTEDALRKSETRMRAVVDNAVDAIITIDRQGIIESVNPATEKIFGYARAELIGQNVKLLMPRPYCDEHDGYISRYLETGIARIIGIGREVIGRRKDGSTFPVDLAVSEMHNTRLFTGIVRDISRRKELEKQVINAAVDEQRRIGQDIHDGLGQELTGLRYMAQTHAESLVKQCSSDAPTAQRVSDWLGTVQRQLRAIIRDLVPVELDQGGLVSALRALAVRTTEIHNLSCEVDRVQPILVEDPAVATHLYHIVQEAVHNAVRHARASRITIRLDDDSDHLRLQITDDGIGLGSLYDKKHGVGISSMIYRAGLIGAHLRLDDAEQGGATVICVVPKSHIKGQWTVTWPSTTQQRPAAK